VFFCASDSSALCLAAFCIFCCDLLLRRDVHPLVAIRVTGKEIADRGPACAGPVPRGFRKGTKDGRLPRPVSSSGPGVTALAARHFRTA
jgi:hypothetical protein